MDAQSPRYLQLNQLFTSAIEVSGGIENFLDGIFSFLATRTDFYEGARSENGEPDRARAAVLKAYEDNKRRGLKKIEEDRQRRRKQDEIKRAKIEKERQEQKQQEEKGRVWEVFSDDEDSAATGKKTNTATVERPKVTASEHSKAGASNTKGNSNVDEAADDEGEAPSEGNGGKTDKYVWTQTLNMVEISIPLESAISGSQCSVKFGNKSLFVSVKNETIIGKLCLLFEKSAYDANPRWCGGSNNFFVADGALYDTIRPADCLWTLEDAKMLHITLEKSDNMKWWSYVVEGDPRIDTKKIIPENSKLSDLDPELRATVEKMMYDQEMKQRGLPTSDQSKQAAMFAQFQKAHPELDFSQAKINFGGSESGSFNFS